ncbi:RING finger and CCCH-type zinc finger domain-containing protein roquin isoform X2 [Megalopta genalis]|uniref:RING finger and CCCH-type zinc finger domain-containing protein roquin isoform X2 n=1 Tax=Megalopta genalis TaxID=115081 RepID=UPI0014432961|nr:roquin-1 isoform X2 [Megalopta genalis]
MPIQAPQWTEFLSCPVCCHDFDVAIRGPISLACGHTICRTCLANLHRKQCPFDQSIINTEIERLPVNEALLQLVGNPVPINVATAYQKLLPPEDHANYLAAKRCIEELALYLKPCQTNPTLAAGGMGLISRPMQRKLVTLVGCQLVVPEGRARAVRAARSLGERSVTELILQHQNPQQLSANLWAAVRARGCQFLGPAMQEEVLKLVLLALEDGSALSRKVLVMFVVQRLESHFPQASKTSIGHVVQLLYRASCFKVSKREGDSSLMQLKEEFRTYEALRREHDAQIVQIATEAGLRIAPDQWSALLYGDTSHKSHMQSIIDKLQTPQSFAQSVQELVIALQRTPDPGQLSSLRPQLERLAAIDPSPETEPPTLAECRAALEAVRTVVAALVEFIQQHGNRKAQDGTHNVGPGQPKYKVSMCRDLALRGSCPRSTSCTFAHSDMELDKYRSKNRKLSIRSNLPASNNSDIKTDKSATGSNNKTYKQNDDLSYHSIKSHDNTHRENFNSINKINPMQHHTPSSENNFVGSLTNYMLPPPQGTSPMVPNKNMDIYCSHYIVPNAPVDYTAPNLNMWDTSQVSPNVTNGVSNTKKRTVAKTLAMLRQRRIEILNELETIVNKQVPQIKTNYDMQADTLSCNFSIWTNASSNLMVPPANINCNNNFRCTDPILFDDEFVPLDASSSNKYGPISKLSKNIMRSSNCVQPTNFYTEGTAPPPYRPMPTANSVTSWYYGNQPYSAIAANGEVQPINTTGFGDNYITFGRNISESTAHTQLSRSECMSKDLILESQRVKQQLKHLEKKINDLKLATQGATFTAGERLAQELQMIEAGIREKEKDVRNWSPYGTVPWIQSSNNLLGTQNFNQDYKPEEEDTYEAGIANDMRELELRWEFELQEQEKHWSSEEDNSKK